ncbi:DUF523 domain-containing protein [Proteiniclasticum sp. QWL-01]|nr:DUF523 domain-containing protein [Proteiniclasticum sp. QWL-01]UUM13471.1 DUF523 domain-containing protein [Clostridiaceae bacterium HFYG-1003]WFF74555.1 DUF523 domain-containing protein [Proteiniclasticum sp. QWL-01]
MKILVSACLLGEAVRYDGRSSPVDWIQTLAAQHELISFCPEVEGGLPVPREAAELTRDARLVLETGGGGVLTKTGSDVTEAFVTGARAALVCCRKYGVTVALLKERSPSCGSHAVYDGSHTGRLIPGAGLTATLLEENGIKVFSENDRDQLQQFASSSKE